MKNEKINDNCTWYSELKKCALSNINATAIFYRNNKISFGKMFENADKLAKSLKKIGIEYNDEIACCVCNIPELIYTMLAVNKIGAKLNLIGPHFDKMYLKSILENTTKKILIASDDIYNDIKDTVNQYDFKNKLIYSLSDSLPFLSEVYHDYDEGADIKKYYYYLNKARNFKYNDNSILLYRDFIKYGEDYIDEIEQKSKLDSEFLITYSGSNNGYPKRVSQSNRSLIATGIDSLKETEISGLSYQRRMCYSSINSNTNLIIYISNTLMNLWTMICEPEYKNDNILNIIRLNNPNTVEMSSTNLIQMSKEYLNNLKAGSKYLLSDLTDIYTKDYISPGEKKFINKVLGIAKSPSKVKVVEPKLDSISLFKPTKDGYEQCVYDEYGIIAIDSDDNQNKIIDNNGKEWALSGRYGYIDKKGNIQKKDLIGDEIVLESGNIILPSIIEDTVLMDSKNILSCIVTSYHSENGDIPIINYELSPNVKTDNRILTSINHRLKKNFGNILENVLFREFSDYMSYPENEYNKRDKEQIEKMLLDYTFIIDKKGNKYPIEVCDYNSYYKNKTIKKV